MAGAHAAPSSRRTPLIVGFVILVAIALVAAGAVIFTRGSSSASTSAGPVSTIAPSQMAVTATVPADASTVDSSASIRIALNQPLAASSPLPTLSPEVPGTWQRLSDSTIEYVQTAPLQPGATVTVTVPGGAKGIKGTSGARLAASTTTTFHVAPMSPLRVQQLLAELGYLPLSFSPSAPSSSPGISTSDEQGSFTWRWPGLPDSFTSLWSPGQTNVVTQGAIMRFQDTHGLATDGSAGPELWSALLADRAAGKVLDAPYNFVIVKRTLPESMALWSNGAVTFTTAVNTGIAASPTAPGTWPVYLRYLTQTMRGENPDGSHYEDPGVPFISYFYRGEALHGMPRPGYGYPQSLGCVEMTIPASEILWPQTPIGTLTTVLP